MTVFHLGKKGHFRKAGHADLIALGPVSNANAIFVAKEFLQLLVTGITLGHFIHISGPTGSAKTSLIESLYQPLDGDSGRTNFDNLIVAMNEDQARRTKKMAKKCELMEEKPIRVIPVEMCTFECPSELYSRRAIRAGETYDEDSVLVEAIAEAARIKGDVYPVIWLKELGRESNPIVQSGLLNLMVARGKIPLTNGTSVEGNGISWIADSNYQAGLDARHHQHDLDDALKRRFHMNLTSKYLSQEQEVQVLEHLALTSGGLQDVERSLFFKIVDLGHKIRQQQEQGNLQSLVPPSIYTYQAFLELCSRLPHLPPAEIAAATLLGNADSTDQQQLPSITNEVFSVISQGGGDEAVNFEALL